MTVASSSSGLDCPPLVYDTMMPGQCLGSMSLSVDADMMMQWHAVYGYVPEGPMLPLAFAPLLLMRAMLTIASPRPPGNLHVGQGYHIYRMPRCDGPIAARVTCNGKEIRKDRRVIELKTTLAETFDADPLVIGLSAIFWAQ